MLIVYSGFDATKIEFGLVGGGQNSLEVWGIVDVTDSSSESSGLICAEEIQGHKEAFAICRNLRYVPF